MNSVNAPVYLERALVRAQIGPHRQPTSNQKHKFLRRQKIRSLPAADKGEVVYG